MTFHSDPSSSCSQQVEVRGRMYLLVLYIRVGGVVAAAAAGCGIEISRQWVVWVDVILDSDIADVAE